MKYLIQAWNTNSEVYENHYIKAQNETQAYQRAFRLCKLLKIEFNQLNQKPTLNPYTKTWLNKGVS